MRVAERGRCAHASRPQLALPGNTRPQKRVSMNPADAVTSSITSKGQVTIPKALRQQFGLARGSRVSFALVGDHIELRPLKLEQPVPESGFGLLKTSLPAVPADFDPASLLRP